MKKLDTIQEFVEKLNTDSTQLSVNVNDLWIVCDYMELDNDLIHCYTHYHDGNKQFCGLIGIESLRIVSTIDYKWVAD